MSHICTSTATIYTENTSFIINFQIKYLSHFVYATKELSDLEPLFTVTGGLRNNSLVHLKISSSSRQFW